MSITLKAAQQQVHEWIQTTGVKYFSILTNTVILNEEIGEMCRHIARQFGEQSYKPEVEALLNAEQKKQVLADEMADVLWVLLCLANQTGVNLADALEKNFDKKNIRDGERHLNNPKLKG